MTIKWQSKELNSDFSGPSPCFLCLHYEGLVPLIPLDGKKPVRVSGNGYSPPRIF